MSDMSLRDIMAQLQHMDAHLDTLSTELYQVNIYVGHIARQQVTMVGFTPKATPSPSSIDSDFDDDNGDDNDASGDDDDGDASSIDEMSA